MKVAICDDEKFYVDNLKEFLDEYYNSLDILIDTFISGEKLINKVREIPTRYDLIFLDIEMEKFNGIEVAREIRKFNKEIIIIFVTSHIEFALQGYEVKAFRYITKPLDKDKLIKVLVDVEKEVESDKKFLIKDKDREILLNYKDIIYVEARNVNILIKTIDNSYTLRKTLKDIGNELESSMFYKTHRSYIVNFNYVADYNNKSITMKNGDKILISRSRITGFKKNIIRYVNEFGR